MTVQQTVETATPKAPQPKEAQPMPGAQPMSGALPHVSPQAVAEIVGALSPRLAKRLDAATAKLASCPAAWTDGVLRIAVAEDAEVTLHTVDGVVTAADAVSCSCLLAPACLHRAAAVSAAPLAATADGDDTPAAAAAPADQHKPLPEQESQPGGEPTRAELDAAADLWRAGGAVLAAGAAGSGAVLRAELLRAAHSARLAGLYRPAAAGVNLASLLRAARAEDPGYRLDDLVGSLRELLDVSRRLMAGDDPQARGTARQDYGATGSLRLYGLFSEPVLTATHVGAVTYLLDPDGAVASVADVLPHQGALDARTARATAGRAVRLGDVRFSHIELSRSGVLVSGATRSATGRLGSGASVRAVGTTGAAWSEPPLSRLWHQPLAAQIRRALDAGTLSEAQRPAGADLLYLDLTVLGPGDGRLMARVEGADATVALLPGHAHPDLPCRRNLARLAARPGLTVRAVGRLVRAADAQLQLLAVELDGHRYNLGLEDLPTPTAPTSTPPPPLDHRLPPADGAPTRLLLRRLERAAVSGRRALAHDSAAPADAAGLRRSALPTAALLLDDLHAAAHDTSRDVFGRVTGNDTERFTRSWLTAACYLTAFTEARCSAAWLPS